nr:hypothetical protein [Clostridia bacterium]
VECAEISSALDTRMQTVRNKIVSGQEQTPPPKKTILPHRPLHKDFSHTQIFDMVTKAFSPAAHEQQEPQNTEKGPENSVPEKDFIK